jgi:hypothetical protein
MLPLFVERSLSCLSCVGWSLSCLVLPPCKNSTVIHQCVLGAVWAASALPHYWSHYPWITFGHIPDAFISQTVLGAPCVVCSSLVKPIGSLCAAFPLPFISQTILGPFLALVLLLLSGQLFSAHPVLRSFYFLFVQRSWAILAPCWLGFLRLSFCFHGPIVCCIPPSFTVNCPRPGFCCHSATSSFCPSTVSLSHCGPCPLSSFLSLTNNPL